MSASEPPLEVNGLKKYFGSATNFISRLLSSDREVTRAVDNVSLTLHENEVIGIIGESGCGKTTLLKTMAGLYTPTSGEIKFKGKDISTFSKADEKAFRKNVQMVFQDPFNSLDPKMTVEEWLAEPLKIHGLDERDRRIDDVLERVELNPPDRYRGMRPGQLSGGQLQRVSIAKALIIEPEVILADEPTSMLDASTQASILRLLSELSDEMGISMLYISHDLSTVGHVCDRIGVMYLGRIVEMAPTDELVSDPAHPYTREMINAIPNPNPDVQRERTTLQGSTDETGTITDGCRFRDRCPERMDICEETPLAVDVGDDRTVACHLYYDHEEADEAHASATKQPQEGTQ
jgi:peptide/nickel transport system ATP-binding protein